MASNFVRKRGYDDAEAGSSGSRSKKATKRTVNTRVISTRSVTRLSTTHAVLNTTELLEAIFLAAPKNEVLRLRAVCKRWKAAIEVSPMLCARVFPRNAAIATSSVLIPKDHQPALPPLYFNVKTVADFFLYDHVEALTSLPIENLRAQGILGTVDIRTHPATATFSDVLLETRIVYFLFQTAGSRNEEFPKPFWQKMQIAMPPITSIRLRAIQSHPTVPFTNMLSVFNRNGVTWEDITGVAKQLEQQDGVSDVTVVDFTTMDRLSRYRPGSAVCNGNKHRDGICHCVRVVTDR